MSVREMLRLILKENQVRIYNKSFGNFVSTHDIHLANNGEINDHIA